MAQKITIFDTTLRDGEQAPGFTMTVEEKLAVAKVLDDMGVDVIEAGFAIASDGDFEAIFQIGKIVQNSKICSLARTKQIDIERAGEAIKNANCGGRIHTFVSTSKIHMEFMTKMSKEEVLEVTTDSILLAKKYTNDIEWSAQDATRTEKDFLFKAIEVAIKAGATTINIPDTVGFITPIEYFELIKEIKNNVSNIDKAILSVHCQNDLGLATANSLCAILAGARQVECTINGIGERAGNTSLEEILMTLKTRSEIYNIDLSHIDTTHIMKASKLVSQVTGYGVQSNKAIVGANAFAHESGIHQDGVLKNPKTYEIIDPKEIGLEKGQIVLGKHSGRHALKDKLESLGLLNRFSDEDFNDIFLKFKSLCDKKKDICDADLISIIGLENSQKNATYKFVSLAVSAGTDAKPYAKVAIEKDGEIKKYEYQGNGPVDSIFQCLYEICDAKNLKLEVYQVHAVSHTTDATGSVTVRLKDGYKIFQGHGSHTDILVASVLAFLDAINKRNI